MNNELSDRPPRTADVGSGQAEHPDPTIPTPLIKATRAPYYGTVPPWPSSMIAPSAGESARWSELWKSPRAPAWFQAEQEHDVAVLVRLEERCSRRRSSPTAIEELRLLRSELGLDSTSP